MHGELAPRLAETVDGQKFQHFRPGDIATLLTELFLPEGRQAQFLPEQASQPAVAEGTGTQDTHLGDGQRQGVGLVGRDGAVGGKERELLRLPGLLVEDGEGLPPRGLLTVVDLAEVEHLPLRRAAAGQTTRFHDAPVAVQLADFLP